MRTRKSPRVRMQPRRPRGRPKAEDVEALEARLVSVAKQAFVLNGYGATSINAIAKAARVSKTTLYDRFPSKAALFQVIVARQIASVEGEVPLTSHDPQESLEAKLHTYVDAALRRSLTGEIQEINRLIFSESHQFPELGEAARARFQIGVQNVARFIEVAAERDRIPCRNAAAAAEVFLFSVFGWYTSLLITNRTISEEGRKAWLDRAISIFMADRSKW